MFFWFLKKFDNILNKYQFEIFIVLWRANLIFYKAFDFLYEFSKIGGKEVF